MHKCHNTEEFCAFQFKFNESLSSSEDYFLEVFFGIVTEHLGNGTNAMFRRGRIERQKNEVKVKSFFFPLPFGDLENESLLLILL